MQGLAVSARAWCWVSKHWSQWQGWSDNTLVPSRWKLGPTSAQLRRESQKPAPHPGCRRDESSQRWGASQAVSCDCREG